MASLQSQTSQKNVQFSIEYDKENDQTTVLASMLVQDQSGQLLKLNVFGIHAGRSRFQKRVSIGQMLVARAGDFLKSTSEASYILDDVRRRAPITSVGDDGSYIGMNAFPDVSNAYGEGIPEPQREADLVSIAHAQIAEFECGRFRFRLSRESQDAIQKVIDYFQGNTDSRLRSNSDVQDSREPKAPPQQRTEGEAATSISTTPQAPNGPVSPLDGTIWKGFTNKRQYVSMRFLLGGALEYTFETGPGCIYKPNHATWKQNANQIHIEIAKAIDTSESSGPGPFQVIDAPLKPSHQPQLLCIFPSAVGWGEEIEATIDGKFLRGISYQITRYSVDPKTLKTKPELSPYAEWTLVQGTANERNAKHVTKRRRH